MALKHFCLSISLDIAGGHNKQCHCLQSRGNHTLFIVQVFKDALWNFLLNQYKLCNLVNLIVHNLEV